MNEKRFEEAIQLRGRSKFTWSDVINDALHRSFENNWNMYKLLAYQKPSQTQISPIDSSSVFGISERTLHGHTECGGSGGRYERSGALSGPGHRVYIVSDGFEGLANGEVILNIGMFEEETITCPSSCMEKLVENLKKFNIQSLLVVGGFEAYEGILQLVEARGRYDELCIPMCIIPATISNNVPGTDFSLGADTAVNAAMGSCDKIKQSATGTKRRVFVVETMGGFCGYLATYTGIAVGADAAYIFEESFNIHDLKTNVEHLTEKMKKDIQRGLVLRNEKCHEQYNTDFIYKLYSAEGKGVFDCRVNVLGHLQQGGVPTPFDRNYGTKLGVRAVQWLTEKMTSTFRQGENQTSLSQEQYNSVTCRDLIQLKCFDSDFIIEEFNLSRVFANSPDTACVIGLQKKVLSYSPVTELKDQTDFEHRMPKVQWWINLRLMLKMLAKYQTSFDEYVPGEIEHVTSRSLSVDTGF
ncbi:ATP-dependent 6-phosphofructokinase, liver type [Triplophysa tibetana]|uniref:ATP-dependent 6-phosphofructokinase, liver type n=1 Tax=Triplophysa tibetana TaxID=1572043 RepID=A0A5A9P0M1_9TELE|nr:ATP-dependent 6-phosphofructokinase, liver type [Triplophysa tibetana]